MSPLTQAEYTQRPIEEKKAAGPKGVPPYTSVLFSLKPLQSVQGDLGLTKAQFYCHAAGLTGAVFCCHDDGLTGQRSVVMLSV